MIADQELQELITEQELLQVAQDMRINLEPWQMELIFDRTTKKFCVNCGRKKGKTTASEFRIAVLIMNGEVPGYGLVGGVAITSKELKAAKQILASIKTILTAFGWRFTKEESKMDEDDKIAFATTTEIRMPNKSRVIAFPAGVAGDNLRPWTFHEKHHDEADFQSEEVFASTAPCLARFNGVEFMDSTPNILGDRNTYFAKAYFGVNPGYKVYHLPSADKNGKSTADYISQLWLDDYRKTHSKREYDREILAEYVSDISSVFPTEILNECEIENIEWRADTAFIGAVYARFDQENTVIAENFYRGETSYLRIGIIPQYGRRIMEAENEIVTLVKNNGAISRVVIDNTSLGNTPIESLAQLIGEDMVIGVQNHEMATEMEGVRSRYMKEDLYVNLLKLMERGLIRWSDKRITNALMDVKYDYSKRNKQVMIFGNDIADAIVRAVFPVWGRKEWIGPIPKQFFTKTYK